MSEDENFFKYSSPAIKPSIDTYRGKPYWLTYEVNNIQMSMVESAIYYENLIKMNKESI